MRMLNRIAAFLILTICLLSCSLEENEGNVGILKKITFDLTHDSPATRASLSGMEIIWSENDCISVFSNGVNARFTATSHSEESVAFTGMIQPSDKYHAIYPYNSSNSVSSDVLNVEIPETQYPLKETFDPAAAVMVGVTSDEQTINMFNACAFIRFEVQNEDVMQVMIQSSDEAALTGCHAIKLYQETVEMTPAENASGTVTLAQESNLAFEPGVYYACVSPGELSSVKAVFHFADGSTAEKVSDRPCRLQRNYITDFGVIDDDLIRVFANDGVDDDTVSASLYGFDYEALLQHNHPRLFMNELDFVNLRERIASAPGTNTVLKCLHENIIANADKYVSERVPVYQAEDNLEESRLGLQHIFACAYAFKMKGERRYLDKAIADLVAFCAFADWHPEQYLCVGETAMGVAIGYDWLYGYLTAELREQIREKLYSYAIGTYKDYYSKFSYSSNWNEVCWGGLTVASIALLGKKVTVGETEMGNRDLIELLEKNMNPSEEGTNAYQLPLLYGPDGSFDEGYSYWNYGTSYEIAMIKALETAFGKTASGISSLVNSDGFLKTDTYMQFMESPLGGGSYATFSYADGGTSAARILWPLFWFADHKQDYRVLAGEIQKYLSGMYTAENCNSRMFPLVMSLVKDMDIDQYFTSPAYPSQRLWYGGDRVQLIIGRDKWSGNATDAYFAMKGGYPNRSHGHMDAGSFVFDYNGERWSHDIPLPWTYTNANAKIDQYDTDSSKDYGNLSQGSGRWWFFYTNNLGHSTISVMNGSLGDKSNRSDQLVGSRNSHADIVQVINTVDEIGGKMDLTPMYSDNLWSINRTIKMVTEGGEFKKLVIIDEITSGLFVQPQIQWRMLTPAAVQTKEGYQELTQNGKTMYMQAKVTGNITSPEYNIWEATTDEVDGWKNPVDRNYTDAKGYHVAGFSATISRLSTVTITTTITDNLNNL